MRRRGASPIRGAAAARRQSRHPPCNRWPSAETPSVTASANAAEEGSPVADIYDVLVIGAGPAGEHAAGRLAGGGLRVAIIERELAGGECSYWGCIPSKTLLRPGMSWPRRGARPGRRKRSRDRWTPPPHSPSATT